jgi:hypothetical protein
MASLHLLGYRSCFRSHIQFFFVSLLCHPTLKRISTGETNEMKCNAQPPARYPARSAKRCTDLAHRYYDYQLVPAMILEHNGLRLPAQ